MAEIQPIKKLITERLVTKIGEIIKEEKVAPSSPIGVFDSGVGGLTLLREIMRQLPNEDVIYLADTARVPFGSRSKEEIIKINHQIIPFLIKQGAKMIIMACGTSSALAFPAVKDQYKLEIVDLIDPAVRMALAASRNGRIGVIATVATINSNVFQEKIKGVKAVACPLFVPLIEGGHIEIEETANIAKEYLKPLLEQEIDTLILGCTHYPYLLEVLRSITGMGVVFVNPAVEAVLDAKKMLAKAGTLKIKIFPAKYRYFVTGSIPQFQTLGSRLLGKTIAGTKQVKLT